MLNTLRPVFARLMDPVAGALARTPVTPNAITITGTVGVAAGALSLFPTGHLFVGTLVCWFFVMADMLDGALARVKGTTGVFGAFLDSTLDRVADACGLRRARGLVRARRAQQAARRRGAVLPGVRRARVVCEGAGRGPGPALRRGPGRALGAAAHRPGGRGPVRAGRTVCARRRPVAAGRGEHVHVRAAGSRRAPGRRRGGHRRRGGQAGRWRMSRNNRTGWSPPATAWAGRSSAGCPSPGPGGRSAPPPTSPGAARARTSRSWRPTCAGCSARTRPARSCGRCPGSRCSPTRGTGWRSSGCR